MQGNEAIIELLNNVLTAELTAVNQYFIHAKMQQNWGYERLYERNRDESIDEMRHADTLIERILFLDGHPNMQRLGPVGAGETVAEQLRLDLELEYAAVERLNAGIGRCLELADAGSREILEHILESEEHHIDWLEAQHDLIDQVGIENYLSQQIKDDD